MECFQVSEENYFYEIFQRILNRIITAKGITEEEINRGITVIVESFQKNSRHRFWDIDLKETKIICGYLFRYAAHGAGLVRCRIQEALRNCHELNSILQKDELKVVSLGGGPGNDVLGFCSALFDPQIEKRHLQVTIIDAVEQWSRCVNLMEQFVLEGNFGNVSKMFLQNSVNIAFIPATLPVDSDIRNPCYTAIRSADIIIECKFFNSMDHSYRRIIIQNLLATVKDEAIIILIHSPFYEDNWSDVDILYRSEEPLTYQLSNFHYRFGFSDNATSKCGIHVIRKHVAHTEEARQTT